MPFSPEKYIGHEAPSIHDQEAIALEFDPPSGQVAIFYKLGKIERIESVATSDPAVFFDNHQQRGIRIYVKRGKAYWLAFAK